MAIQTINLTVPGGDTPRSANTKINANFSNTAHAASRLVGKASGDVAEFQGALGLGGTGLAGNRTPLINHNGVETANQFFSDVATNCPPEWGITGGVGGLIINRDGRPLALIFRNMAELSISHFGGPAGWTRAYAVYTERNTTKDGNGFLKGASPVVDLYADKINLNHDANEQGGITLEKVGVGDYLIKGSLGLAKEGWYIEMPKDANGNVLVAVVYEQLANNDLSIKTYAKRFDDETGDIVANLIKPRDIPDGRFISLRLHELPKEPPVMPTQNTSADAPAQTTNP